MRTPQTSKLLAIVFAVGLACGCNFLDTQSPRPADRPLQTDPAPDEGDAEPDTTDDSPPDDAEAPRCKLVTDRMVGTVSAGLDVADPDLAIAPDGAPHVAWAVEDSRGPIHIAREGDDGWSTTSSQKFRLDPDLRDLRAIDLAFAGSERIAAAYSANYRGDTHNALTLFTTSTTSWTKLGEFGERHHLESPLRTDDEGRLHVLTARTLLDDEGDEDGDVLRYAWGVPGDLEQRTLYERHDRTVEPSTLARSDAGVRAFFRDPNRDWGFFWFRPGASSPEQLDDTTDIDALGDPEGFTVDADGTLHLLGRTEERNYAIFRRRQDGSWESITVAEQLDEHWRDECRDDDASLAELDGTTCEVDHTSYSLDWHGKKLFRRDGEVWVAKTRRRTTGTATWQCDQDYHGCLSPCSLDRNVETERTVVMGPVRDGKVAFEEVAGELPPRALSTAKFGPEGDMHVVYVHESDAESPRQIRYGRVRCR